jgi:hypothetical protein
MLPEKGRKLYRGAQDDKTDMEFSHSIAITLKEELGSTHQAVKTVMRWSGAGERTVKHWFAGTHGPSGKHLVALMRHSDAVLTAVLRMADREPAVVGMKILAVRDKLLELVDLIDAPHDESKPTPVQQ